MKQLPVHGFPSDAQLQFRKKSADSGEELSPSRDKDLHNHGIPTEGKATNDYTTGVRHQVPDSADLMNLAAIQGLMMSTTDMVP